ncbi:MAG: MBL fold metallo-hydrolase, partial [Patescibacteria group bacterium]|nr:MBL fold metallo-hydrolase [Patescibacteria group bacterium]
IPRRPHIMNNQKITFCTGVGTVTGANFLLETPDGTKILIDCGLVQGERVAEEENRGAFPYDPASIHALFVTHAHLDHVGRIPRLVKEGFKGDIYSTPQTRDLARLVLEDAVGILAEEAKRENKEPLYGLDDVQAIFPLWKTIGYHQAFRLNDKVSVFLKDAGHILGSSMFEFSLPSKVLFTGDLGNSPHPLLRDTEPAGDVDHIVMESTYGDRNHPPKSERIGRLAVIVNEAMSRGGTLVIPAFSVDRAQVLLYELNNLTKDKKIPPVPVFFDSPLAEKVTGVYRDSSDLFNDDAKAAIAKEGDIFAFPHLKFVESNRESKGIDRFNGAKIILAGSGMSVGGRVIGHEEHFLPDPKSTILLVGYQAAGSLGRELANGASKVRIHGQTVKIAAKIETLYGYSAHKDSDHLVEFVSTAVGPGGKSRLKQVFVVMGEPGAEMHLAQRLNDELDAHAVVPERLKAYEIQA